MGKFIHCTKNVEISNGAEKCRISAGFIGEVPGWVEKHWYFNALCKDGTITTVTSTKDAELQNAEARAAEAKVAAEKAAEKKRLIDAAKNEAKVAAEKMATDQGLDQSTAKTLIKKMMEEAEQKVLAELGAADAGKN